MVNSGVKEIQNALGKVQNYVLEERVPPICQLYLFQWPPPDVSTSRGPEVNKFEQVSVLATRFHYRVGGGLGLGAEASWVVVT